MKEKDAPVDLCREVLRRLDDAGVLRDIVLIGSWCAYFYKDYFLDRNYLSTLRTRDVDFLISTPPKFRTQVDVAALLKDLGFIADIGSNGLVRLTHPELIIDFLVPEKGRGGSEPYPIKALGINAQPLRFVNLLLSETITINSQGISLKLPHPVPYAFQKLIISHWRRNLQKREKDRLQAVQVLRAVVDQGDNARIKMTFRALPPKWRKAILDSLKAEKAEDLSGLVISP